MQRFGHSHFPQKIPPKRWKWGPQNEFPGVTRTEGFCGNSTEKLEFPGISRPIPISDLGVPIFSVLGEMKLICRAALNHNHVCSKILVRGSWSLVTVFAFFNDFPMKTSRSSWKKGVSRRTFWKTNLPFILGALKGTELRWQREPKTQIFAENRRFSQIHPLSWKFQHVEGAGNRRKPQIFAENLRFSQKTAGNCRLGSVTLGPSPLARPYSLMQFSRLKSLWLTRARLLYVGCPLLPLWGPPLPLRRPPFRLRGLFFRVFQTCLSIV